MHAPLLETSYDAFAQVLLTVDDDASWRATGCLGWSVRDLTHHHLSDLQRALVALHRPTDAAADRDAVGYWRDWTPDPAGAANGRRHTRVAASMFLDWGQLRELHLESSLAVRHAAGATDPATRVRTQGHVLRADDLVSTLVVEAWLHHLDLVEQLPGRPAPPADAGTEVRRVLDGLLGAPVDVGWTDERYARVATGRAVPDAVEAAALGDLRARLPLLS